MTHRSSPSDVFFYTMQADGMIKITNTATELSHKNSFKTMSTKA